MMPPFSTASIGEFDAERLAPKLTDGVGSLISFKGTREAAIALARETLRVARTEREIVLAASLRVYIRALKSPRRRARKSGAT